MVEKKISFIYSSLTVFHILISDLVSVTHDEEWEF
jgi:hypothetical protein